MAKLQLFKRAFIRKTGKEVSYLDINKIQPEDEIQSEMTEFYKKKAAS